MAQRQVQGCGAADHGKAVAKAGHRRHRGLEPAEHRAGRSDVVGGEDVLQQRQLVAGHVGRR